MNCFFCFRMCNAKISKKGTLTNISVAVRFSELPRIRYPWRLDCRSRHGYCYPWRLKLSNHHEYVFIRGGWVVVTATDNNISVAVQKFKLQQICSYLWQLRNRLGYVPRIRDPKLVTGTKTTADELFHYAQKGRGWSVMRPYVEAVMSDEW